MNSRETLHSPEKITTIGMKVQRSVQVQLVGSRSTCEWVNKQYLGDVAYEDCQWSATNRTAGINGLLQHFNSFYIENNKVKFFHLHQSIQN